MRVVCSLMLCGTRARGERNMLEKLDRANWPATGGLLVVGDV
jgi:hypothetical protein